MTELPIKTISSLTLVPESQIRKWVRAGDIGSRKVQGLCLCCFEEVSEKARGWRAERMGKIGGTDARRRN